MLRAAVFALICSLLLIDAPDAIACAPAPPQGEEVQIAEEEAIILWDPATRTETFIRSARFFSTARSFGFLVPTPAKPELGEISMNLFPQMADRIRPEIREKSVTRWRPTAVFVEACVGGMSAKEDGAATTAMGGVNVIGTARVAGFDATTVEADDARALAAWLDGHGFATTPALTAWLERYVAQKWKLTAFVVASGPEAAASDVALKAVRMTFQTDRPFYPYREPAADAAKRVAGGPASRILRVHFLSNERHAAALAGAPWSARVLWAAPVEPLGPPVENATPDEVAFGKLAGHLRFATVFVDESYPRRGIDEVYFAPSTDRTEVRPPPLVMEIVDERILPLDLIAIVLLLAAFLARRLVRRRRAYLASLPPRAIASSGTRRPPESGPSSPPSTD